MTYSWIATSSYNTALQRMLYFILAKTIERFRRSGPPFMVSPELDGGVEGSNRTGQAG
jgi:hypothetical protein